DALGESRRVELAERALHPVADVGGRDGSADRRDANGGDVPALHGQVRDRVFEQVAQGGDRGLGLSQFVLQTTKVSSDQVVTRAQVGGLQDRANPLDGHAQVAQSADHLGGGDLVDVVPAVAGVRVDLGGLQQIRLVVVAQ